MKKILGFLVVSIVLSGCVLNLENFNPPGISVEGVLSNPGTVSQGEHNNKFTIQGTTVQITVEDATNTVTVNGVQTVTLMPGLYWVTLNTSTTPISTTFHVTINGYKRSYVVE